MMNMPIVISPQSKKDLQLPRRGNWGENLDYHHLQMDEVEINLFEVWKSIISDLWQQTEGTWLLFRGGGEKLVVWAFLLLSNFLWEKIIPLNFVFWVNFLQSRRGEASLIHNKKHRQVTKLKDGQIGSIMKKIGKTVADFDSCKCPSVK